MKEWKLPEIKELDIANTEGTYLLGNDPDGDYITCWCGIKIPLNSTGCFPVPNQG